MYKHENFYESLILFTMDGIGGKELKEEISGWGLWW